MTTLARVSLQGRLLAIACAFFATSSPAATFYGSDVLFSVSSDTFSATNLLPATVADGNELGADDGTLVGNQLINSIDPGQAEYIDIGVDFIEFGIRGGLSPDPLDANATIPCASGPSQPDCQLSAYAGINASYLLDFSSSSANPFNLFEPTEVLTTDIFGLGISDFGLADLQLGLLSLSISDLLVDADANFGIVRLNFTERVDPIPLPAALPLMLSGLGAIAFLSLRRRA